MSDYVPSKREVRETWMDAMVMHSPTTSSAEFDRFIAKVRSDALREAQSLLSADGFFCPALDDRIEGEA